MHYNINITIINVYITINNIFTAEYFDYIHIPLVFGVKAGPRILLDVLSYSWTLPSFRRSALSCIQKSKFNFKFDICNFCV